MTADIAAVLDTNVLASGFVRPKSIPGAVLSMWRAERFRLAVSEHILDELERTLANPYFRRLIPPQRARTDLQLLRDESLVTPITSGVSGIATHPEDDLVLATAVSAGADYLVTGDRQLLRLGSYEGVTILDPRAFLDVLSAR